MSGEGSVFNLFFFFHQLLLGIPRNDVKRRREKRTKGVTGF